MNWGVDDHFRLWLRAGMTGCEFAKLLAGKLGSIAIEWSTHSGDISDMMGFAPFPMMPVPRRSPYVALATWPGGRSNPFRGTGSTPPGRPGVVSFLDAPHGLDRDAYEDRWKRTSERVTDLMSIPPDDARLYRRTTFVLAPEHAEKLAFDPS